MDDGENVKHEGPLSEGEDRDDYGDRENYEGKWGDKDGGGGDQGQGKDMPPETNIEEMDKFLSKVKKERKEEMLERNKEFLKSKE